MPDKDYIIVADGDGGFLLCKRNKNLSENFGVEIYDQEQYYHDLPTILRDEFDIKPKENEDDKA